MFRNESERKGSSSPGRIFTNVFNTKFILLLYNSRAENRITHNVLNNFLLKIIVAQHIVYYIRTYILYACILIKVHI